MTAWFTRLYWNIHLRIHFMLKSKDAIIPCFSPASWKIPSTWPPQPWRMSIVQFMGVRHPSYLIFLSTACGLCRERIWLSPLKVFIVGRTRKTVQLLHLTFNNRLRHWLNKCRKWKTPKTGIVWMGLNGSGFKRRFVMLKELNTQESTPNF